jgi:transposase
LGTLKEILRRYKTRIDLWVDHARFHKGKRVSQFLTEHRRLTLDYILKYHPELNFQEALWRTMRYEETTNTYYETMEQLVLAVFNRSHRWKPKKMRSLCHNT